MEHLQVQRLAGVCALPVLLFACATPAPVIRLSPRGTVTKWVQGSGVLEQEKDGLRVAIAYDRNQGGMVAFRLEVANNSPVPVVVDAPRSRCYYCKVTA